jgi:hypothetical protein
MPDNRLGCLAFFVDGEAYQILPELFPEKKSRVNNG